MKQNLGTDVVIDKWHKLTQIAVGMVENQRSVRLKSAQIGGAILGVLDYEKLFLQLL